MSRKVVDIKRLLQAQENRKSRLERPLVNCVKAILQCSDAGELILAKSVDKKIAHLLERSVVISAITAVEVYFRDILSTIFKVCTAEFFEPHLKQLFPEKLDIAELLELQRHQISPLELVLAAQSFQNIERIDSVFSKFLSGSSLMKSVVGLRLRIKGDTGEGTDFTKDELLAVSRLFALRHEIVHDPARHSFFVDQTLNDVWCIGGLVVRADIVLMEAIKRGLKPEFSVGSVEQDSTT
jgi:hypothetical protein